MRDKYKSTLGFKIVKKHFESKSQPMASASGVTALGFKIVKKHFESKSQLLAESPSLAYTWF